MGIIDILTDYSPFKKFEHFVKVLSFGPTISTIPPKEYADRLYNFIRDLI